MINRILNSKTNNLTSAAFLIAASTFLSGALSLLQDRLLAAKFGAGQTLDVYFTVFKIPDLLYNVLVIGGIGSTFLPFFSKEFEKDKEKAFEFASNVLNCSIFLLLIVCLILSIFTPQIVRIMVPGFTLEQKTKTAILTRIMLLSPILFCLSSIFSGIVQYFDKFLIYSMAPILYNLGIILGILFLVPRFEIYGLILGVLFGAFLHFIIQVPAARNSGFHFHRILDFRQENLKKMFKISIPSAIGSGFSQLNLMVITALASMLSVGAIAIFSFSKNLQTFPVGMIGLPFAISTFPALSRFWASKQKEKFWDCFSTALRQILFLTIPISILIFILRAQIVRIILGAGAWGWLETRLTAASLGLFSLSIFAFSLIPLFQRGFYSIHDTKTPTVLQVFSVGLNIVLSFSLLYVLKSQSLFKDFIASLLKLSDIKNIQIVAFPLAMTISGIVQSVLLFFVFIKKINSFSLKGIFHFLKDVLILTGLMVIGVRLALTPLAKIFPLVTFWGVFFQTGFATLTAVLIYFLGAFVMKFPELENLNKSILARIFKK